MFKKKTITEIDVLNLLHKMENKIDILQSNNNSIQCNNPKDNNVEIRNISNKIDKLNQSMKSTSGNVQSTCTCKCTCQDLSLKMDELIKNNSNLNSNQDVSNCGGLEFFKKVLDEKLSKSKIDEISVDFLSKLNSKLQSNLQTKETAEVIKRCDDNLRKDLHEFILGIKDEIIKSTIEHINFTNKDVKIEEKLCNIDDKVSQFFYDNEIIKQQLSIENDLRKYMDEIDNINKTIKKLRGIEE